MAKTEDTATTKRSKPADEAAAGTSRTSSKPVYEKPRLRRYDQIDQVKPYGPSEL